MKITQLPVLPTPTGAETLPVVSGGTTKRTTLGTLMASVGQPYVDAAKASADQASAFALILEATTAGGWFKSLDLGAAAVAEGEGFFVNDGVNFYTGERLNGVGVKLASFMTRPVYVVDVRDPPYNAKGDCWQFRDGVIAAGSLATITFANTGWKASAVAVGNPICIIGAGPGGAPLATTIAGFVAPGTIRLATPAAAAMAVAKGEFGTNDRPAIQAAIDFAASIGNARVSYGGAGWRYLLAGAPATYGTFTGVNGTEAFQRGMLQLRPKVSMRGGGAKLIVSGGHSLAPGIFYTDFWTDPTIRLDGVRITGLKFDGNVEAQVVQVYPAGYAGNVWQHGSAITATYCYNFQVDRCEFRNLRGDAVRVFGNDLGNYSRFVRLHDNDLANIFTQGYGLVGEFIWVERNLFHGDGYWVGAIDLEVFSGTDVLRYVWVMDNTMDFSDGLAPVERTPQFASNSPEAVAAQRRTRRAVSIGFYQGSSSVPAATGASKNITFARNKIIQGVIDTANIPGVEVYDNQFTNAYEDLTGQTLVAPHCISAQSYGMTGITDMRVTGNTIDSDLNGWGIFAYQVEKIEVAHNFVKKTRQAGIILNASSGSVHHNDVENVGSTAPVGATFPQQSSAGIFVIGSAGRAIDVSDNDIRDLRAGAAAKMDYGVFVLLDGGCTVQNNRTSGMSVGPTNASSGAVYIGNRDMANVLAPWVSSVPISVPSIASAGDVTAGGAVTGSGHTIQTKGGVAGITFLSGDKVLLQVTVDPTNADGVTLTFNRFTHDGSAVADQPIIVKDDGSIRLANGGIGFYKIMPIFPDNASAIAGGVQLGFAYKTAAGQLWVAS